MGFSFRSFDRRLFCGAGIFLWTLTVGYSAIVVPPVYNYSGTLGGNTATYSWDGFVNPAYPLDISGTSGDWGSGGMPAAITPTNVIASNIKFAPTPGFASETTDFLTEGLGGGLYSFFSPTHLSIVSTEPISSLKSLVFQIYMADGTSDPFNTALQANLLSGPALTLTLDGGGTQVIPLLDAYVNSSEPATINFPTVLELLSYQWDLSSVSSPITGYTISWQTSYHSIIYGMSSFESDAIHNESVLAVPEPSSLALLGLSALVVLPRKRRPFNSLS